MSPVPASPSPDASMPDPPSPDPPSAAPAEQHGRWGRARGLHRPRHRSLATRVVIGIGGLVVVAGVAVTLTILFGRPRVSVSSAGEALFTVHAGGLGTELRQVRVSTAGRPLAVRHADGGLVPDAPLAQGQVVEVRATAAPPDWLRWLVGGPVTTVTTVRTPTAAPSAGGVVLAHSARRVPVRFDTPVSRVQYQATGGPRRVVRLDQPAALVDLRAPAANGGFLRLQVAPRPWERLSAQPTVVTWFVPPADGQSVAVADPPPNSATASSNGPITLTFDQPVSKVLGTSRPTLSPAVPGQWSQPSANRLVFTPSGFGFGPGASVTVRFGHPVDVASTSATTTTAATSSYTFRVASGSLLRMAQILAQLHYLPLRFIPAPGMATPTTFAQEVPTMSDPLPGTFSWRWSTTPAPLTSQWTPASPNVLLRGALMAFESNRPTYTFDGYTLDGESVSQMADAATWKALLLAAAADQVDPSPYSYVYVTKALPETLTLWENGANVLTALVNTGIPQDPTTDGTFPIYVRYTINYMNGTNPNGTKYHDLVYWINYFNGGDAVHGFVRASYGFPQSLGCVELPIPTAQTAFNDLAIGDLVTVTG